MAESLVAQQRCASIEEALWELALSAVQSKITYYRRRISRLKRKYAADLEAFTARLQGRATPVEEDDWFAWRSAERMLTDWQQAYRDLVNARPR